MIQITIFQLCMLKVSTAFLLGDNCPAPSPCTCSESWANSYINCNGKGFTEVPRFTPINHHVDTLTVYLNDNDLKHVPSYAFKNLSSINVSNLHIQLSDNQLTLIDSDAFLGLINPTSVYLYLYNNNLTSIPLATTKINFLIYLNIEGNPIRTLDDSVMLSLGSYLKTLVIDLSLFTEWPRELGYLSLLQTLNIQNMPFAHLETDIFHGFENSLTSLTLEHAKQLEKVPLAVCNLSKLLSLSFSYCPTLIENRSSVFEHCQGRQNTVTDIRLNYDDLHSFPDVFHLFPSLKSITVQNNNLELIESEKIPSQNLLTSIYLQNNKFKRIPSAFHKAKSLTSLWLANNELISIEDCDFNGLKDMTFLTLDNNPLRYISPNAFEENKKLRTLYLQHTRLTTIPASVLFLPMLRHIYLNGAPIECSCDMSYLKHWNVTAVSGFNGQCVSMAQQVKQYLTTSLQQCP